MDLLELRLRRAVDPLDAPHPPAPAGHRRAAVLLLFDVREPELPLLFMQRAGHLRHHAGQVGFPGGVAEAHDATAAATALRECTEETGVPPEAVEVIGLLPPLLTATSDRWLTPVVGLQREEVALVPDDFEVDRLFRLSLGEIALAPHAVRVFDDGQQSRRVHFYEVRGTVVWGVTGAIIDELLTRMAAVEVDAAGQR